MKAKHNQIFLVLIIISFFFRTNGSFAIVKPNDQRHPLEPSFQEEIILKSSIIILIGDGMGPSHIEFGRLLEYGPNGTSSILNFPYTKNIATNNVFGLKTDSAAAATAISTGYKTINGYVGQDLLQNNAKTILELAEEQGYNTGLIATSEITHATPAAFSAHNSSRNNYLDLANDMAHQEIELFFGGGNDASRFGGQYNYLKMSLLHYQCRISLPFQSWDCLHL